MEAKSQKRRTFLFHPILFGLYPVLALYVFNQNEIVVAAIQQAVLTSLIITGIVISVFWAVFRSWQKAAAPASLTLLLFFTYGHVYDFAQNVSLFGEVVGRNRFLIPLWILLFIVGLFFVIRSKKNTLNEVLNSVSLFLMLFVLAQIVFHMVRVGNVQASSANDAAPAQNSSAPSQADRDVYYILLDAYSRQDLLQKELGLDISDFLAGLKDQGFYVPNCTQSNYDNTLSSMTATLNMDYLEALGVDYFDDKGVFRPFTKQSRVIQQFKEMGYSVATFRSLYKMLDLQDETYYFDYFEDGSMLSSQASLNFQYLFLKTTLLRPLVDYIETQQNMVLPAYLAPWLPTANALNNSDYQQYQQNVFALDTLEKMPQLPGKKFVYAHLYVTHQPFVFYPDGRFHPFLKQGPLAYRDQVIYANTRLLTIVQTILAQSDPDPIIVIQADHSYFRDADRVKILNAYYLPDGGNEQLYDTITPVNTFRVIFNTYFDGNYDLLPDVSRYGEGSDVLHEAPSTCVE